MRNKKALAHRAWLSKPVIAGLCLFSLCSNSSFAKNKIKPPFPDQPLFLKTEQQSKEDSKKNTKPEPRCIRLSRGPGADLEASNPGLQKLLNKLLDHLKKKQSKDFQKLFHPRAKVPHDFGERVFAILSHRYESKWDLSVFRVWAFVHPEKQRSNYKCEGDPEIILHSRYGYAHQYGIWLQIMGNSELGRIFVSVAPVKDHLWITGFHIQQWTHLGHDWEYWTQEGNKALEKKDQLKAYLSYDVAQKLLVGGDFIDFVIKDEILKQRDLLYTRVKLVDGVRKSLKNNDIVYVGTVLSPEGTGLLIREQLQKVPSTHDLQKKCHQYGLNLLESKWLRESGGLRCSFIVRGEPIDREGQLGGFYISQKDIMAKSK